MQIEFKDNELIINCSIEDVFQQLIDNKNLLLDDIPWEDFHDPEGSPCLSRRLTNFNYLNKSYLLWESNIAGSFISNVSIATEKRKILFSCKVENLYARDACLSKTIYRSKEDKITKYGFLNREYYLDFAI